MYIERKPLKIKGDKWLLKYWEKLKFQAPSCLPPFAFTLIFGFNSCKGMMAFIFIKGLIHSLGSLKSLLKSGNTWGENPGTAEVLALHNVTDTYLCQCRKGSVRPESARRIWLFYSRPLKVQLPAWSGWWQSGTFFWNKEQYMRIWCETRTPFDFFLWQKAWRNHSCRLKKCLKEFWLWIVKVML